MDETRRFGGNAIERLETRRLLSAGDPDATFGVGGQVEHDNPGRFNHLAETVVLPDGKFLIAGSTGRVTTSEKDRYFLRRLNADGSLDATFGTGGTVLGAFSPELDDDMSIVNVAVAPGGQIYTTGWGGRSAGPYIARFNANGALDTTFGGGDGHVRLLTYPPEQLEAQPDGKLLGINDVGDVTRYLADGALDPSFGVNGVVANPLASASFPSQTLVVRVQGDGKLLLGGSGPALARLNADGSLDTSFGAGGRVLGAIPGAGPANNGIYDIAFLPGGGFLAAGTTMHDDNIFDSDDTGPGGFVVARYGANGAIDASYGTNGAAMASFGRSELERLLLDANGNAYLVGVAGGSGGDRRVVVARLTPQGQLDESFGRVAMRGYADPETSVFVHGPGTTAAIAPDGKLLVLGRRIQTARDDAWRNTTFLVRLHTADDGVASPVSLDAGRRVMSIVGTPGRELLTAQQTRGVVYGLRRGYGRVFDAADVAHVELFGREGDDYLITETLTLPARATGGLGLDRIVGGSGDDTLEGSGGRDFIDAGGGGDVVNGGGGNDGLRGQDGDDTLYGADGDDELRGGAGVDVHDGGAGNNLIVDVDVPDVSLDERGVLRFVDSGDDDDRVSFWADGAGNIVVWANGVQDTVEVARVREVSLAGNGGNDLLKLNPGLALRSTLRGEAGDDTLIGGANVDEMYAGDGEDALTGNAGPDDMAGEAGHDTLRGGAGNDYLDGTVGNDRFDGGLGDDTLVGGAGNDVLVGGPGADDILGLAGNDVLLADDGFADTVHGGPGSDTADADDADAVVAVEATS